MPFKSVIRLLWVVRNSANDLPARLLGWVVGMLADVSPREFPPGRVPEVAFDLLNGHYRDVVALARLILRHGAFESGRGGVRASGFLMDMNVIFQEFLTQALREELGASPRTLRSDRELEELTLDHGLRVNLEPDLTWWDGPTCTFVGDAKYKNFTGHRVPNGDLYQMLSYATALDLPRGTLGLCPGRGGRCIIRHPPRWQAPGCRLAECRRNPR